MKATYNLNGLITVEVDGPRPYIRYFENEYRRMSFPADMDGEFRQMPHVRLKIVDDMMHLPVRKMRFKNLLHFTYAISDLETACPTLHFQRHWLDRAYFTPLGAFIQGQLLEPLMYLKLLEANVLFMHAAGVAKGGNAYVFPAHGGTGKTTMSLDLVKRGFELMGDDLLMVDAQRGVVHSFARPLHLFTYNLRSLDVPLHLWLIIRAKDGLRLLLQIVTGQKFLISTRVHVDEIMDISFADSASLEQLTFLKREGESEILSFDNPAHREMAIKLIVQSADLNESLFQNIVENDAIKAWEIDVVRNVLSHVNKMQVINARQADRATIARNLV